MRLVHGTLYSLWCLRKCGACFVLTSDRFLHPVTIYSERKQGYLCPMGQENLSVVRHDLFSILNTHVLTQTRLFTYNLSVNCWVQGRERGREISEPSFRNDFPNTTARSAAGVQGKLSSFLPDKAKHLFSKVSKEKGPGP